MKELKRKLNHAYKDEEVYWAQKARAKWLQEGDRNIDFFHASVNSRRRKNSIHKHQRRDDSWCEERKDIEEEISGYYRELFHSSNPQNFVETLTRILAQFQDK
ncbi:hypothetical protein ACH5RR_041053 [Cinchona calisaya]|uniref:Uncharacterized protein n=1 Tax=Cinchona calisaya TaxID=153742 RepID=A0ABD2XSW1_9GENT